MSKREHLFISYASEDGSLAEWLTLRLTAEGYKVWCDRFELLGGESYPKDIDAAIKERTFRMLALLSRHSLRKPNPVKERILALNIAKERKIDFLIPLNVDGLRASELDWMTSDLTFIPLQESWASGVAQLLKKLNRIEAPRTLVAGRKAVRDWFSANSTAAHRPETVWTNALEILELPPTLLRVTVPRSSGEPLLDGWPHRPDGPGTAWSFVPPPRRDASVSQVNWKDARPAERLADVATDLIRQHIVQHCTTKGMALTPNGRDLYFPPGLLPNDRLTFRQYTGRKTYVAAVGQRAFRLANGARELSRYHLSAVFRPKLRQLTNPAVLIQMRVHLTTLHGQPLDTARAVRRRKAICRSWWNHQWLARLIAVTTWMAGGGNNIELASTPTGRLLLSATSLKLAAPVGLDEGDSELSIDDDTEELIDDDLSVQAEEIEDAQE